MALSANTVCEVRTDGSDTNGGGFTSGGSGTDWSQQAAAQYSVTDGVTNGTTTITSATANFGTDVVDNLIYVQGGTGSVSANWYRITSRTNATTIVVDRSTGLTAGTGVTLTIGGALATPGGLGQLLAGAGVTGTKAHIKSGTYTLTTSSTNVSGGPIALPNIGVQIYGYNSTRGDLDHSRSLTNNPVVDAGSVGTINVWGMNVTNTALTQLVSHITVDGNGQTDTVGFSSGNIGQSVLYHCLARDCTTDGFISNLCIGCRAEGCADGFDTCPVIGCVATTCTTAGFRFSNTDQIAGTHCLAYENTATGFICNNAKGVLVNCTSHGNTGGTSDGFQVTTTRINIIGCVATSNGRYGFNNTSGTGRLIRCAAQGNSSGATNGTNDYLDNTALSGDPYTNSGSDDYSPDNTASEGAALRAAMPLLPGQTVSNLDSGAVQHVDPTGGGVLVHPGMSGRLI
jgi:hypothetical protein